MLYFIKSQNYLKVGYTQDKNTYKKRMNGYKTCNPDFCILDVTSYDGLGKPLVYNILSVSLFNFV